MKSMLLARRYGEAFVAYAKETIGLEEAIKGVKALKRLIRQNPELEAVLLSPEITTTEKFSFLDSALKGYLSEELLSFLKLVVEKRRAVFLTDILDYIRVNYAHAGTMNALLKSAYPLDLEDIALIKEKLEARLKKKLHFYLELDPQLIGGVQVTAGNTVFDGSLRKRLDELKGQIASLRMV